MKRIARINPDLEARDLRVATGDNVDQLFMFVTI